MKLDFFFIWLLIQQRGKGLVHVFFSGYFTSVSTFVIFKLVKFGLNCFTVNTDSLKACVKALFGSEARFTLGITSPG